MGNRYFAPKRGNSLAEKADESLLSQWDTERNTITPEEVSASSSRKVWWRCPECSYSWEASINNRYSKGTKCPYCFGNAVWAGKNDFATTHPDLIKWWDDPHDPTTLRKGSRMVIQWKCPRGHVFKRTLNKFNGYCKECTMGNTTFDPKRSFAVEAPPEILDQWHPKNLIKPDRISYNSAQRVLWLCHKGHEWETSAYQRINHKTGCPICSLHSYQSRGELEIGGFLTSLGISYSARDRRMVPGHEIDLFIPDRNIGIEFNGLYWHSDQKLPKNYHYDKWLACKNSGIQLIQIWEDDWARYPELVKNLIAHKLGMSSQPKIGARSTSVKEETYQEVLPFFTENHIQGPVQGTYYLSLFYEQERVASSVWTKRGEELYLDRFATSCIVQGGLGKLMGSVPLEGVRRIVTFAAHEVSNGDLYQRLGFHAVQELPPDYSYVVNDHKVHKFNYRKSRFEKDPQLKYHPAMTERQLAELNNLRRGWDAGKTKYVRELTS